jgi:hypothetical protein
VADDDQGGVRCGTREFSEDDDEPWLTPGDPIGSTEYV